MTIVSVSITKKRLHKAETKQKLKSCLLKRRQILHSKPKHVFAGQYMENKVELYCLSTLYKHAAPHKGIVMHTIDISTKSGIILGTTSFPVPYNLPHWAAITERINGLWQNYQLDLQYTLTKPDLHLRRHHHLKHGTKCQVPLSDHLNLTALAALPPMLNCDSTLQN